MSAADRLPDSDRNTRRFCALRTIPPPCGFRFLPFNSLPTLSTWGMMQPLPNLPTAGPGEDDKKGRTVRKTRSSLPPRGRRGTPDLLLQESAGVPASGLSSAGMRFRRSVSG
jgi:hypothetical protein